MNIHTYLELLDPADEEQHACMRVHHEKNNSLITLYRWWGCIRIRKGIISLRGVVLQLAIPERKVQVVKCCEGG